MSIYVIGACPQGPLKIGIAKNPAQRLRQLQTGHPQKLFIYATGEASFFCIFQSPPDVDLKDSTAEKFLHRRYSSGRMAGEWFDADLNDILYGCDGVAMTHGIYTGDFQISWELTEAGKVADLVD